MKLHIVILLNQHADVLILSRHEWERLQNIAKQHGGSLSKGKKDCDTVQDSNTVKGKEARKMAVALKRAAQSRKDDLLFDEHKPFNECVLQELGEVFFRTNHCTPTQAISILRSMAEQRGEILEVMFLHRFAQFCEAGPFKVVGSSLLSKDRSETQLELLTRD